MKKTVLLILLSSLFLFSCRKPAQEGDIQSAEDQLMAENEFTRIYELVEEVAERAVFSGNTQGSILPAAARLNFSDSSYTDGSPVMFTIDFGAMDSLHPVGLICVDGKYRTGKIQASLSSPWSQKGALISVSITEEDGYFSGYGQQMQQYLADATIERLDTATARLQLIDAAVRYSPGTLRWSSEFSIQKIYDAGPGWWNDRYEIRGLSSGINVNGSEFEVEITSPLLRDFSPSCNQTFNRGSWILKDARGNSLTVDYDAYGDAACDRKLIMKWNSFSRLIEL